MLDPWIIEEIRKREDRIRREERPMMEIPLEYDYEQDPEAEEKRRQDGDKVERGVVILDLGL